MKKIVFLCLLLMLTVLSNYSAKAGSYVADDQKIDQLFNAAPEATANAFTATTFANATSFSQAGAQKDAVVAIVLDFFLGELGIHRFYLGTKVMTGIGYIITCGGIFGIVPLVDFIELIINYNDISQYVDNPKFFMWAK